MKLLLLILLVVSAFTIDQQCEQQNDCPNNAFCLLSTDMCACNTGFIGNCNTPALPLTTSPVSSTLANGQTQLYYVNPIQLNVFIQFLFTLCITGQQNVSVVLTLWGETGENSVYLPSNSLVNPTSATLTPGCQQFVAPYTSLGSQPNGQNEMLILGITDFSQGTVGITASVSQQVVSGFLIYYYILIAMVVVVVIVIIIGVAVFIIRRRRRSAYQAQGVSPAVGQPVYNNIDYFQKYMPTFPAEQLGPQKQICSICLQNIEFSETVRQTLCKHTFHATCIDSWCLKNLSCPVCRTDFGLDNLEQTVRNLNSSNNGSVLEKVDIREEGTQMIDKGNGGKEITQAVAMQAPHFFMLDQKKKVPGGQVEEIKVELEVHQHHLQFDGGKYEIREHML